MAMPEHTPVLLREVIERLSPEGGRRVLDGTLGFGGHAAAILKRGGESMELAGIDQDRQALEIARERLAEFGERVHFAHCSFDRFPEVLAELQWDTVDRVLLDLGVSSLQLDQPDRGFSFIQDGPLDMRMNLSEGKPPARNLVNKAPHKELKTIIKEYGEEPLAGRIASAICSKREEKPIETTLELASIVEKAYPAKRRALSRTHPATKTFQALRIAVNEELNRLHTFLEQIFEYIDPGGRIGIISFHSLEDRIVKQAFKREAMSCVCPPRQPVCTCSHEVRARILTKKPITASPEEIAENPRSRSAKFRVAERVESHESA